ncbi:MAG TPA: hypothetical protein VN381_09805 [Anaerovoracaceae bacterium]|nr:hypothetical protein [Anaerovoracaceae bacterium]
MDMRVPLEVTSKSMKGTDDAWVKGFFAVEGEHPVCDRLGSSFEKKIQKGTVLSEKLTEFLRDGEDNVPVAAVDQFCGNGISAVCLIGSAAGIAEAGLTAERHIVEVIAVMAVIETIALFKITAIQHFLNFVLNNRPNTRIG